MFHPSFFKDKKVFMMMTGLPGAGKDFFINNFFNTYVDDQTNWLALGTDDIIEEYAAEHNTTYNDAYHKLGRNVEKEFKRRIRQAFDEGKNVIWNQTNMSKKSRMKKLQMVPGDYYKICVNIAVDDVTLKNQLKKRELETNNSKTIPVSVINSMAASYDPPEKSEGFDKIINV